MAIHNPVEKKFYDITGYPPGVIWLAQFSDRDPLPYCKKHIVKLNDYPDMYVDGILYCPKDRETFTFHTSVEVATNLARQEIFDSNLKQLEVVRIDPEGYQVLARELNKKDPRYWIDVKLSETSKGLQLMVQAGKRNKDDQKVQLFVEPSAKRLGFDQGAKDQHPNGIFKEVRAIFKDSQTVISDTNPSK